MDTTKYYFLLNFFMIGPFTMINLKQRIELHQITLHGEQVIISGKGKNLKNAIYFHAA